MARTIKRDRRNRLGARKLSALKKQKLRSAIMREPLIVEYHEEDERHLPPVEMWKARPDDDDSD
jgi:hypothetical protein